MFGVYLRLIVTCPTCGYRVNGKRFTADYSDLAPKAMFTIIQKGVKGLNTVQRDIATDGESQRVVESVKASLAMSLVDTLVDYTEVIPWLRKEILSRLAVREQTEKLTLESVSELSLSLTRPEWMYLWSHPVGIRMMKATGVPHRDASQRKSLQMAGNQSSSRLVRTVPRKSSMLSPTVTERELVTTSKNGDQLSLASESLSPE